MSASTRRSEPPAGDTLAQPVTPVVEFVPGEEATGRCPTLRVDGALWHDPDQPFREVLSIEGKRPQVVALFGVGLGYTAAGVRHLSPGCRVVAWEPLPGMAQSARKWLRDEWSLDEGVEVEGDLADFQARLIEACRAADTMAVVMLEVLGDERPELAELFLEIVQEVIDAGTFTLSPRIGSGGKWARIAASLPRLSASPELAALAGSGGYEDALVIASPPTPEESTELARKARSCLVTTIPDLLPALERSGIRPDLLVVGKSEGPSPELARLARECVFAITPDSAPEWWSCPARGRFVLGHTGCSWLLEEGDPGLIASFRYGPEIPMVVTAIALGARRISTIGFAESGDASWNLLAASRRRDRALERIADSSGAEIEAFEQAAPTELPAAEKTPFRGLESVKPSGERRWAAAIERAGRQTRLLLMELDRYRSSAPEDELLAYLVRRAETDGFTRSFLLETPFPGARSDASSWRRRFEQALGFLELARCQTPMAAEAEPAGSHRGAESREALRVFIGAGTGERLPARVLEDQIRRVSEARPEVMILGQALEERLGAPGRSLSLPVQKLLIPFLCGYQGRALYIEPSVVLLDDPRELWEAPMGDAIALVPAAGPASLLLLDNERCPWKPEEILPLARRRPEELVREWIPSKAGRVAALPERWAHRDELTLQTAAMRYTCLPWLPWKNDLHPISWAWRFFLALSLAEGPVANVGATYLAPPLADGDSMARPERPTPSFLDNPGS